NGYPIRFKRWSRRGYALFVAVKRVVTIGALGVDIVNQSLLKTSGLAIINGESSHLSLLQKSFSEILSNEA
ncbi:MAG: hypothetical protein SNG96_03240, partial [Rikenellaceae bacterium]